MAKLISNIYGEALFELAVEEEKTDAMLEEIDGIKNVFLENPEYLKFLNHPRISAEEKIKTTEITINFFDFSINIFKNYRNLPKGYAIIESERHLRLFGRITLPISVTVKTAYLQKEEPILYSEAEAIRLAGVRLRVTLSALLSEGEMESLRTVGQWQGEHYVLTVHYVQIRNVAHLKPIQLTEEK